MKMLKKNFGVFFQTLNSIFSRTVNIKKIVNLTVNTKKNGQITLNTKIPFRPSSLSLFLTTVTQIARNIQVYWNLSCIADLTVSSWAANGVRSIGLRFCTTEGEYVSSTESEDFSLWRGKS